MALLREIFGSILKFWSSVGVFVKFVFMIFECELYARGYIVVGMQRSLMENFSVVVECYRKWQI